MTIEEFYRKLKEKDKNYIVMENQWGTAFTVYYKGKDYKDYKLLHVYLSKLVQLYGWNLKLEGLIFREELIDEFIRDLEVFDFNLILTADEKKTLVITVMNNNKCVLNIDLERIKPRAKQRASQDLDKSVYIFNDLSNASTYDLDQYAWLFARVSELIHNLERVESNE